MKCGICGHHLGEAFGQGPISLRLICAGCKARTMYQFPGAEGFGAEEIEEVLDELKAH